MIGYQRGFGLGFHSSVFENIGMPLIIMAVLGWVAWGAYGDYRARTQVEAGLALAAAAQAATERAHAQRGAGGFAAALRRHWTPPPTGEIVESIRVADSGVVTVRYTARVADEGENQIQIVPLANGRAIDLGATQGPGPALSWQCGGAAGITTVPASRRPESCR